MAGCVVVFIAGFIIHNADNAAKHGCKKAQHKGVRERANQNSCEKSVIPPFF